MIPSNIGAANQSIDTTDDGASITRPFGPRKWAIWFAYIALLGGAVLLFSMVRTWGDSLAAMAGSAPLGLTRAPGHAAVLPHLLLALAVVASAAQGMGYCVERFLRQPPVVGEIAAGIVLGPSCLGALAPDVTSFLFPSAIMGHIGVIASIGVVLFMFLVGLEMNLGMLRESTQATLSIAHASIVVPFSLGALLSLLLYPVYSHRGVDFTVFSLFVGTSLSVTAFPVLVRILGDWKLQATPLGTAAIGCAAVDDASAWCLLAFVSGFARAKLGDAVWTVASAALFVVVMWLVVRPLAVSLVAKAERSKGHSSLPFAVTLACLLVSAAITEGIGIHALFGAFAFGACLPHCGWVAEQLKARLNHLVVVLFLPVFFAFTGLRTHLALVGTLRDLGFCILIIAVASLGKFGGCYSAARYVGTPHRHALALGVLMNTRGLMELIVLNVGFDMGVLSPTLFAMLVVMALVTTFATSPLLAWLKVGRTRGLA
jgi:Kef-type K+ transport system membrane component KefB